MKKGSKFAIGTVIAAGAGYLTGILSAPRSGKQTRQKISKSATKARVDSEKQLKKLHSELQDLVKDGENQVKKTKNKANTELKKHLDSAKKTKDKTKLLISAIHGGEATDPDLKKMLNEAKKAKDNLAKFIKK